MNLIIRKETPKDYRDVEALTLNFAADLMRLHNIAVFCIIHSGIG